MFPATPAAKAAFRYYASSEHTADLIRRPAGPSLRSSPADRAELHIPGPPSSGTVPLALAVRPIRLVILPRGPSAPAAHLPPPTKSIRPARGARPNVRPALCPAQRPPAASARPNVRARASGPRGVPFAWPVLFTWPVLPLKDIWPDPSCRFGGLPPIAAAVARGSQLTARICT